MLSRFAKYVIVGHSERRLYFNETDKIVAKKAEAAVAHNITPIICVGETLHENEDGLSKVVVMNQVETALSHLTASEVAEAIIAYEPVWAIGTGRICKPATAEKMAKDIRGLVKAIYGEKSASGLRILYGGSVSDENVSQFAGLKNVDGVLVGGASLDHKKFSVIVKEFEKTKPKTEKKS
jgi:triosephosphate isomerase